MADILTTKHKSDVVRDFYQDLQSNDYYVLVSSLVRDPLQRETVVNSQYSKNKVLENVMFGKKLFPSDIHFMIKYYPWQKDTVFDQYDDTVDLEGLKFYAIVEPNNNTTGDYRVYKCLSNNNATPSIDAPDYVAGQDIYETTDGYVWKYMYVITDQEFEAYNAIGYVPLVGNFEIYPEEAAAAANTIIEGAEISDIFVENYLDNVGYPNIKSGVLSGGPQIDGRVIVRSEELNEKDDYFVGMTAYITNSKTNTNSFQYLIENYFVDPDTGLGNFRVIGDPKSDGVEANANIKVLPTVKITGDGTGASAIAEMVGSRVNSILVTAKGNGYHNVRAEIVRPLYDFNPDDPYLVDTDAELRPILSPIGGHNFNLIDEMHCRHVAVYGYITESENNQIGASGSYSAIAIVKNPSFKEDWVTANGGDLPDIFDNRLQIITDQYNRATQGTILSQRTADNEVFFEAYVHGVSSSANTVYLSNYMGPYQNSANSDISLDTSTNLFNELNQIIRINTPVANNVIESPYVQRTGTIYYMEDFFPLTRSKASREEYKLVLEF